MAEVWHSNAMTRIRISTTVDGDLIETARKARPGIKDSALIDEALEEFVFRIRAAEIDASYESYDRIPLDTPDEWGDLQSFHEALDKL